MPRIQQNYADQKLQAGQVAPEAGEMAFNPSAGMGALGAGMANLGESVSRVAEKKKFDDEYRWVLNSSHQYTMEAVDFENNPENKNAEDFGIRTRDYLEKRQTEYLAKAPSQRAANRLKAQLDNVIESRYQRARAVGENTKMVNAQLEIDRSISDSMQAYRADASNSPEYAAKNLEPQMDLLKESILERWADAAPGTSEKFLEHIETQFVAGTAEFDTVLAKRLLDGSRFIDEAKRTTLLNHIERNESAANNQARFEFGNAVTEHINLGWDTHQTVSDVPLSQFEAVYGKKDGPVAKAKFDSDRIEANQAAVFLSGLGGANPNAIATKFDAFVKSSKISHTAKSRIAAEVNALERMAATDPWAYVAANNFEVGRAYEHANALPPDQRSAGLARANKLALEYQGYAPEGTPEAQRVQYQNLPTNARHLMGRGAATARSLEFAGPATEQLVKSINEFVFSFPEEQRAIAFNDLATLPSEGKRVSAGMQWAFLHRDKPWVKEFMGAQNADSIKSLTPERKKDFEDALFGDAKWAQFAQSIMGDSGQRADELAGYKDGLINYSYLLSLKGAAKSPSAAVREASNRLIGTAFGFPQAGGIPVIIQRQRRDGTLRTDEDIKGVEQSMKFALRNIPADQVTLTAPDGRNLFPMFAKEVGDKPLQEVLPKIIERHGFFVPTPDGHGATLYLTMDDGVTAQLLDKSNQPWEIDFDKLPTVEWTRREDTTLMNLPSKHGDWIIKGKFWRNYPRDEYKVGTGMQPVP